VIDHWGGRNATFEIVVHDPPSTIVHRSQRGNARISWVISVRRADLSAVSWLPPEQIGPA
jgi:hypothetical protein